MSNIYTIDKDKQNKKAEMKEKIELAYMEPFATNLKTLRLTRNIQQKKLAEELNMTATSLSTYESGSVMPSLKIALKIADYFGVSLDFLFNRQSPESLVYMSKQQVSYCLVSAIRSEYATFEMVEKEDGVEGIVKITDKNVLNSVSGFDKVHQYALQSNDPDIIKEMDEGWVKSHLPQAIRNY